MVGEVDKILEKLPIADGRFRRRMMGGGIVLLVFILTYQSDLVFTRDTIGWGDILSAPSLLLVALVIVYALGGVIEILGQIFVIRAVGEAIHFFRTLFKRNENQHPIVATVVGLAKVFYAIFGAYLAILKGLAGKTEYEFDPSKEDLSIIAANSINSMPARVQNGITYPLGNNSDFAIQYMEACLNEQSKKYIHGKFRNSREMLVFLTSVVVCIAMVYPKFYDKLESFRSSAPGEEIVNLLVLQIVGLLIILLFRGYFILLHSAIGDLVELYAESKAAGAAADELEGARGPALPFPREERKGGNKG